MLRKFLVVALGMGLAAGGGAAAWHEKNPHGEAQHGENQYGSVKPLAQWELTEKWDSKLTTATAVEVTLEVGQAGAPHHHPGPALGYVLEGEYEWAIDDQPAKVLKVGETFYEPAGCLHRVSKNPGKLKTRVLAWVIHPRESQDLVIPVSQEDQ